MKIKKIFLINFLMINNNLRIGIIGLGRWGRNILNTVLELKI